jgi:hypothetical protein
VPRPLKAPRFPFDFILLTNFVTSDPTCGLDVHMIDTIRPLPSCSQISGGRH